MSDDPDPGAFRPPQFDVTAARDPAREGTVVWISGELDIVSEPELSQVLAGVEAQPILLDLSELSFMDSSGLRAMLTAARAYPGMTLRGPLQPPVKRLLELTQTLAILPLEAS